MGLTINAHHSPEYDGLGAGEEYSQGPGSEHHQPGPPPLRRPVERQQRGLDGDKPGKRIFLLFFIGFSFLDDGGVMGQMI